MQEPKPVRIIKKYQNRKLYDTQDSCYITLEDIAAMVRKNEEVKVIDNKTKGDVTSIILTQILVDQEKAAKSILPLSLLKDIIRKGQGSLFEFIQQYVILGLTTEQERREEAERYVTKLVARGEISKNDAKNLIKEVTDSHTDQSDFDQWVGQRVTNTLRDTTKFGEIETTIRQLNEKLERLEGRVQAN
ncbi:MAG: polyhydroxyalkanoate synthesis regulator DNA-binding domain-containing protein [Bdellovibrionales bacterium]|nr:polyhydroxyalkanoate synthesis regulator DNA-binding domain-containing protein [Bdellovibrionales bacterium]